MADVFKREDARSLLNGKHILFIGDSNIRALYKDVLWLYKKNSLIDLGCLKRRVSKLENSFLGDRLIARSELTRGRDFTEHRIFEDGKTTFEFLFVTRCYCDNILKMINDIKIGAKHCPDVILMNSCLWDVSRWGPNGVSEYKSNMDKLMKLLTSSLPKHVLFIWATALPIAAVTYGGLIIKQIEFIQAMLRIHVIEANSFTASLVASYGYDVLDFHHYMRYQIMRRSADGIHFLPAAMRYLTNLLLTHIALSWDVKLPGNLKNWKMSLASNIENAINSSANHEVKQMFRKIELIANKIDKFSADTPSKRKQRKKKIQNIRVTHYEKPSEEVKHDKVQKERIYMKTPPNYHKAPPVLMRTVSDIQNNNVVGQTDCSNDLPSSSNHLGPNILITKQCDISNVNNDVTLPEKDFRLIGFEDFNQSITLPDAFDIPPAYVQPCNRRYDYVPPLPNDIIYDNIPHPAYTGSYNYDQRRYPAVLQSVVKIPSYYHQNFAKPAYNYYDRFSDRRNHPYKTYHDDRMVRRYDDPFQNNNPGPMRQRRKRKYKYRR
ncbi:unnamed protein product [Nezara viridula]|uniref:Uncharacterized protein n=1 Tax=Nezara viridula TaxID=85310 RepID=A0A9P0H8R3_NEZVI|nr:unnamed protein product [Nezara viridula]